MSEIRVQIILSKADFPSREDRQRRWVLEDAIEDAGLGEVIQAGGGVGLMEIVLDVERPDLIEPKLRELLLSHDLCDDFKLVRASAA